MLLIQGGILVFFVGTQQMVLKTYIHLKQSRSKKNFLQTFHFSQSKFDSLKIDAKEFRLNDEMYDIESIISSKGYVKVVAYKDSFENKILSLIDKYTDEDKGANSSIPDLIKKITSLVFIVEEPFKILVYAILGDKKVDFCYTINCKDKYLMDLLKPPCLISFI